MITTLAALSFLVTAPLIAQEADSLTVVTKLNENTNRICFYEKHDGQMSPLHPQEVGLTELGSAIEDISQGYDRKHRKHDVENLVWNTSMNLGGLMTAISGGIAYKDYTNLKSFEKLKSRANIKRWHAILRGRLFQSGTASFVLATITAINFRNKVVNRQQQTETAIRQARLLDLGVTLPESTTSVLTAEQFTELKLVLEQVDQSVSTENDSLPCAE